MLGFIKRLSKEFQDPFTVKSLYMSLVRSRLEYACCVWQPFYAVHIARIERIQEKFVKYALRRLRWDTSRDLPPYTSRCMLLSLETLETRDISLEYCLFLTYFQEGCHHLLCWLKSVFAFRRIVHAGHFFSHSFPSIHTRRKFHLQNFEKESWCQWSRPKFPILGFLSVGRFTFFDTKTPKLLKKTSIDNQGLIYLPITKSSGLLAPTVKNRAMNYE
jgi:hypothetical protein